MKALTREWLIRSAWLVTGFGVGGGTFHFSGAPSRLNNQQPFRFLRSRTKSLPADETGKLALGFS